MRTQRSGILSAAIVAAASTVLVAGAASAASFKAKHYPECYAPVAEARAMVPPPPADIAGTVKTASEVANVASKIPGLGGLGGLGGAFGGFGGAAKQVATYSNLIADAAQYTSKMRQEYPDPAARIAAYGDKMSGDADKIGGAAMKIDAAQTCYANAATALKAGAESGEIKERDVKGRTKEILGGLKESKSVLDDSQSTMSINMKGYNDALNNDTGSMGLDLGALAQVTGAAQAMPGAAGLGGLSPGAQMAMGTQYEGYVTGANAYQQAWFDGYTKSGGDVNAAKLSALAAIQRDGGASANVPANDYQQAYWAAQAQQAKQGTVLANPAASLGGLSALQSLGGLSGLSGGGAAFLAANGGIGALGSAINGGGGNNAGMTQAALAQAQGHANATQALSAANAMKGMSGGGAAFVGANVGIGMLGDAITGKNKQAEAPPAPVEMTPAMKGSLVKASVDNSKFSDAYGLVSWQSQRNAEIAATLDAK